MVLIYNLFDMDEKITELTYKLKEQLQNDPRIIALNESEKKMNESEEVMALSYRKDCALDHYNQLLKYYSDDSKVVVKARQDLASAKKELESHPLVRDYLQKYQQVRLLFEQINQNLFSMLNNDMCPKENK